MLEKMSEFFERRLEGYESHMLTSIQGAKEFYAYTAACLPKKTDSRLLDLGCGTGLELEYCFALNPRTIVTGIDVSEGMLSVLKSKWQDKQLELICGSYFEVPFEEERYDAAVSVESLHHFSQQEKIPLYSKLYRALKKEGFFILTDYFALSREEEMQYRRNLLKLKKEQGISGDELYHYDTPLTVEHETEALLAAGFSSVEMLSRWGATHTLKAIK